MTACTGPLRAALYLRASTAQLFDTGARFVERLGEEGSLFFSLAL